MSFSPINGGIPAAYSQYSTGAHQPRYTGGASHDSYTGKKKDEPGFFKKALTTTLKLGGLLVGALAIKRYCLSPATVEKIAGAVPGFIKGPFNAIANTGVAKTVTGWGESLLNQVDKVKSAIFKKSDLKLHEIKLPDPDKLPSPDTLLAGISEKQDLGRLNRGSHQI